MQGIVASAGRTGRTVLLARPGRGRSVANDRLRHRQPASRELSTVIRAAGSSTDDTDPEMQRYKAGSLDVLVPITAFQKLPNELQAAGFLGIAAGLAVGTVAATQFLSPWAAGLTASDSGSHLPIGAVYVLAGIAHFTAKDEFQSMYPPKGAWGGLWVLPGSASFHVAWTGVAEIVGGLGVALPVFLPAVRDVAWLGSAAAAGLFLLTTAVTPSNIFMVVFLCWLRC